MRRKSLLKTAVGSLAAIGLLFGAVGCAGGGGSAGGGDDTLRIAVPSMGQSVNPVMTGTGQPDQFVLEPAYDSLIFIDGDGKAQPRLATEWGYVDDQNTVFQLKLREGVKFSDGTDFNAPGLKKWWEYWQTSGGTFASRLQEMQTIDVIDDYTIQFTLKNPDPLWEIWLSQNRYGFVASPQAIEDPDALGTHMVGAGPYEFKADESTMGTKYVFEPRDDYWDKDRKLWGRVEIDVIADPNAALSSMQSGQIDFAVGQARDASAAEAAGITVTHVPFTWNSVLLFDRNGEQVPALASKQVRQALNYAVDREAVTEAVFGEYAQPNVSMVDSSFQSFDQATEDLYSYDPDKALQLLAEGGYPDGFEMEVCVWNRNGNETTWLQSLLDYYKAIGVNIKIKDITNSGDVIGTLVGKECPAFAFYGQVEESNQLVMEQLIPQAGALNPFMIQNDEILNLFREVQTTKPDEAGPLLKKLQATIVEDASYANYSISDVVFFTSPKVAGLSTSAKQPNPSPIDLQPAS